MQRRQMNHAPKSVTLLRISGNLVVRLRKDTGKEIQSKDLEKSGLDDSLGAIGYQLGHFQHGTTTYKKSGGSSVDLLDQYGLVNRKSEKEYETIHTVR